MIGVLLKRSNLDTALHAGKMPSEHQSLVSLAKVGKFLPDMSPGSAAEMTFYLLKLLRYYFLTDNLSMFLFGLIIIHWQVFPFPPLGHKEPIIGNIDNWLLLHGEYSQDIVFFFFFFLKMSPLNPNSTFSFDLLKEGNRTVLSVNFLESPVRFVMVSWAT